MLALALGSSKSKPYLSFYMLKNGNICFLGYLVQEGMKSESTEYSSAIQFAP